MEMFRPLKFGTSGLRDKVTAMIDIECYINTRGFIRFLKERGEVDGKHKDIVLGGDLRSSTPRIISAVARAVEDSGCKVIYCGYVPTPALAYYAMNKKAPGIMVTGSHVPDDRNGIKFTKRAGEILKTDEADILSNVEFVREEEYAKSQQEFLFNENGMFKADYRLPEAEYEVDAIDKYINRYFDVFRDKPLSGRKIVLYQHSAVGRDIIQKIFEGLGSTVIPVGRSSRFIPVDTEKVSSDTFALLRDMADKHNPFAIITTDGDSDRPLLADESGQFVPGDKLGALVSMLLHPDFVAIPISANDAVVSSLEQKGVEVRQTRIGSPYVIDAMCDKLEECPDSKVVSWESNGGFLLGSDWTLYGNLLKALPTRDAVLPLICILLLAIKENVAVSKLVTLKLPGRFTHADVVDDKTPDCEAYTAEMGKSIIKMLSPENSDINQVDFTEGGLKVNSAEPDSGTINNLVKIKEKLRNYFRKERGFEDIVSINFLDGIRVKFYDNDVAHLRPSGNAPEFRMYATADTQERANKIISQRREIISDIIRESVALKG